MLIRWIFSALHLLALGIGLGSIYWRAKTLRAPLDQAGIRRVLTADTLWGIAAILWIATGLMRAFAGLEKGTAYYLNSSTFLLKMGLLVLVLILEILPAVNFVRWRISLARNQKVDLSRVNLFSNISYLQAGIIILMIFTATAMARGLNF